MIAEYVLTNLDESAVDLIKKASEKQILVDIEGEFTYQYQLKCLINPTEFLIDVVSIIIHYSICLY